MKRVMPPGNGLPPMGYLLSPKGMPRPLNCSWCDAEYDVDHIPGLVLCPDCDLTSRREAS